MAILCAIISYETTSLNTQVTEHLCEKSLNASVKNHWTPLKTHYTPQWKITKHLSTEKLLNTSVKNHWTQARCASVDAPSRCVRFRPLWAVGPWSSSLVLTGRATHFSRSDCVSEFALLFCRLDLLCGCRHLTAAWRTTIGLSINTLTHRRP